MNAQLESIQSDHLATVTGGIDFGQAHQAGEATGKAVYNNTPQALRWNPVTAIPAFAAPGVGYLWGAGRNVVGQASGS